MKAEDKRFVELMRQQVGAAALDRLTADLRAKRVGYRDLVPLLEARDFQQAMPLLAAAMIAAEEEPDTFIADGQGRIIEARKGRKRFKWRDGQWHLIASKKRAAKARKA